MTTITINNSARCYMLSDASVYVTIQGPPDKLLLSIADIFEGFLRSDHICYGNEELCEKALESAINDDIPGMAEELIATAIILQNEDETHYAGNATLLSHLQTALLYELDRANAIEALTKIVQTP